MSGRWPDRRPGTPEHDGHPGSATDAPKIEDPDNALSAMRASDMPVLTNVFRADGRGPQGLARSAERNAA